MTERAASIVKFIIIVAVFFWMSERDREQTEENKALSERVVVQERIISDTVCGPTIEMVMPIGKES